MKNIFSAKLYIEGLKKLRVTGMLCLFTVFALSVVSPFWMMIFGHMPGGVLSVEFFAGLDEAGLPLSILYKPLFAVFPFIPFVIIQGFSFLFSKTEADFYFSMPNKRICLFTSLFASCLTWILGSVLLSFGISSALWAFIPNTVSAATIASLLPALLCAILFTAALCLLSVTLTGRRFSAIILTLLLLFIITFCPLIIAATAETLFPALPVFKETDSINLFLTVSPTLSLFTLYAGIATPAPVTTVFAIGFVLLTALSLIFFVKRRSEYAESPALTSRGMTAFRCLAAFPFIVFGAFTPLASYFGNNSLLRTSSPITVIVPCMILLLVWFLFDLVLTKKTSSLLTCTKQLPILLAMCTVYAGTFLCVKGAILSFEPKTTDVSAVYIDFRGGSDGYHYKFESAAISNTAIDDEEVVSLVCDAIKHTNTLVKEGRYYENDVYEAPRNLTVKVTVHMKNGRSVTREVVPPDSTTVNHFLITCAESEGVLQDAFLQLPPENYTLSSFRFSSNSYFHEPETELAYVWQIFKEEYASSSTEEKIQAKRGGIANGVSLPVLNAGASSHDNKTHSISFYVPDSFTRTRQAILDVKTRNSETGELYSQIFDFNENVLHTVESAKLQITVVANGKDFFQDNALYYSSNPLNNETFKNVLELTVSDPLAKTPLSSEGCYVYIAVNADLGDKNQWYIGTLSVSEETALQIKDVITALKNPAN